jgi:DNA-binding NarL/FixJ family response regulator
MYQHPDGMRGLPPHVVKLTPREREIIDAILSAASNRAIAARLGISEQSVKNRLTGLYKKLGVSNRVELVLVLMSKLPDQES